MKKHAVPLISLFLLLTLLLSACAPAATPASPPNIASDSSSGAAPAPAVAPQLSGETKSLAANNPSGTSLADPIQRLVIRNATLGIIVKDPGVAMDSITKMTEQLGGYVVTSNLFKTSTSEGIQIPQAEITVRIPAEKLTQAMDQIKALVDNKDTDVLSENVSGQDVTKDYTDQKSRLTNLQNTEKQLQKIMDETTKTEDVLAVYNQLVAIREQIEVTKGQIQYYEESAALSSISVRLQSQAAVKPINIAGWQPIGVARDAVQALLNTMQFLGSALIWMIIFLLPIVLVLIAIFMVLRFIFRKIFKPRPRPLAAQPPAPQPPAAPQK
jgi:hypothetical protein